MFAFLACGFTPSAASAAKTPPAAVVNLSAWYDASDSSTIGTTSTAVSQLLDKSGHGATLVQPAKSSQPALLTNGLNGLSTIVFNGYSDFLYGTTGFPTSSDFTIVYLGQMSAVNTNNLLSDYSTSNSTSHAFWGNTGQTPSLYSGNGGAFVSSPSVGSASFICVATYNVSSQLGAIYNNGTSAPATGSGGAAATDPSIEIGGFAGAQYFLTGTLGEALVYGRVLTTAERQSIEGYVAWKWGLQANLPAGHPYAAAPPQSFTPLSVANLSAWYDASDATSVTTVPGVTRWNDKSGNAPNLTTTAQENLWPVTAANSINGLTTVAFAGGQYLDAASGFPTSSDYTVAAVAQFTGAGSNNIFSGYTTAGTSHALYGNNVMTPTLWQNGNVVSAPSTGTAAFLAVATSTTAGAGSIYVNGGAAASASTANTPVSDASIEVGGFAGAANFLTGNIGEILVYHTVLSTAERQFVEGYLACKWGLTLPAGHPYHGNCPLSATASLALVLAVSPAGSQSPNTVLTYATTFTNSSGTLVYNPVINVGIPAQTYFAVGSASAALGTTGLSASISYSQDGGSTYSYAPVSGAGGAPAGYDGNVTNIRWTMSGALGPAPSVDSGGTTYNVLIK